MSCGLYLQPLMTMRTSSVKRKKEIKQKLVSNLQQKGDRPQLQHAAYEKKCCSKSYISKNIFKNLAT